MTEIISDIKHGLKKNVVFTPHHLVKTVKALSALGYKNSELIPLIFDKLERILDGTDVDTRTQVDPEKYFFGGKKGYEDRHYVYRGFENNEEFQTHLQTLQDWQTQRNTETSENVEINDTLKIMERISGLTIHTKEI